MISCFILVLNVRSYCHVNMVAAGFITHATVHEPLAFDVSRAIPMMQMKRSMRVHARNLFVAPKRCLSLTPQMALSARVQSCARKESVLKKILN